MAWWLKEGAVKPLLDESGRSVGHLRVDVPGVIDDQEPPAEVRAEFRGRGLGTFEHRQAASVAIRPLRVGLRCLAQV